MEPKTYEAKVDDHLVLPFTIAELEAMDLRSLGPDSWHFIHEGRSYKVELELADYANKYFELRIDGFRHRVRLSDPYDVLVQRLGLAKKAVHHANEIKAPMPGLIREVLVSPGQELHAGDAVLILEAMKMENIIKTPGDGRIAEIRAAAGAAVEKGQVLVVFD
jgi:biotin carboxyl carrier protein